ncbi:unnamed protein product, partial [Lampetra planeri]
RQRHRQRHGEVDLQRPLCKMSPPPISTTNSKTKKNSTKSTQREQQQQPQQQPQQPQPPNQQGDDMLRG